MSVAVNGGSKLVLEITVNGRTHPVQVPEFLLKEARDFFVKLDRDMDRGCQMSRRWVDNPNNEQRCQIVADRIWTAVHRKNQALVGLCSAYILRRLPGVRRVCIDTSGDITQTTFGFGTRDDRVD